MPEGSLHIPGHGVTGPEALALTLVESPAEGSPGCVTAHVEEVAILSKEWVLGGCACLEEDV